MSPPYILALPLQLAELSPTDHVLKVGASSRYAAAVLAELVHSFVDLETIPEWASMTQVCLNSLGITHAQIYPLDASYGYRNDGPYDASISAAAPEKTPKSLLNQ